MRAASALSLNWYKYTYEMAPGLRGHPWASWSPNFAKFCQICHTSSFEITPGLRGRPWASWSPKFATHGALRSLRGFVVAPWASWSPKICNTWSFEITPGLRGRPWASRSPKLTSHGALRSLWGFVVARICNTLSFEITPGLRGCPWALWLPIISPKICYKTIKRLWILMLKIKNHESIPPERKNVSNWNLLVLHNDGVEVSCFEHIGKEKDFVVSLGLFGCPQASRMLTMSIVETQTLIH